MRPEFNVCVFCGAHSGISLEYQERATQVGQVLAREGIGLVYGGGSTGLMGRVADGCLQAGGWVEGVIPEGLFEVEVVHTGLHRLHVVSSMHARKATMSELSRGFLALPGGLGTLEELFEVLTWAKLGIHQKPVVVLNVSGYFDLLVRFLDQVAAAGFMTEADLHLFQGAHDLEGALHLLRSPSPAVSRKPLWVPPAP